MSVLCMRGFIDVTGLAVAGSRQDKRMNKCGCVADEGQTV